MNWKTRINGDDYDLNELKKSHFNSLICITENNGEFYLESSLFANCETSDDVRRESLEILKIINGAKKLYFKNDTTIEMTHVIKCNNDGINEIHVSFSSSIEIQCRCSFKLRDEEEVLPADEIKQSVALGLKDNKVKTALRLLGNKPTDWVNLYRIFEVIESDVGSTKFITQKNWLSEKVMRDFKHTANCPNAIGDEARHGKGNNNPPKNPMQFSEARVQIERLLQCWIKFKLNHE